MIYYKKFYVIENLKDYKPGSEILPPESDYIIAILLTRPLEGDIILYNLFDEKIYFPKTSFINGGIYPFPISKIEYLNKNDNGAFIGLAVK